MKKYSILCVTAIILAGCNQTVSEHSSAPVSADNATEELPPIYEPLVDMNRVKVAKFNSDVAVCRRQALPQERAARAAAQQAQAGAMISLAGSLIGVAAGRGANAASGTLLNVGDGQIAQGAARNDAALNDYVLIVNTCLRHRGYVFLR